MATCSPSVVNGERIDRKRDEGAHESYVPIRGEFKRARWLGVLS